MKLAFFSVLFVAILVDSAADDCCCNRGARGPPGHASPPLTFLVPFATGITSIVFVNVTAGNLPWYAGFSTYFSGSPDGFEEFEGRLSGMAWMMPLDVGGQVSNMQVSLAVRIADPGTLEPLDDPVELNVTLFAAPLTNTFQPTNLLLTLIVPAPLTVADGVIHIDGVTPATSFYEYAPGDRLLVKVTSRSLSTTAASSAQLNVGISGSVRVTRQ